MEIIFYSHTNDIWVQFVNMCSAAYQGSAQISRKKKIF